MPVEAVGLQRHFATLGVDHPALHGDGDGVHLVDYANFHQGNDASGRQGQVDGPAGIFDRFKPDLAHIRPGLIQGDLMALFGQVNGQQRAARPTTNYYNWSILAQGYNWSRVAKRTHDKIPSSTVTNRWMSAKEL